MCCLLFQIKNVSFFTIKYIYIYNFPLKPIAIYYDNYCREWILCKYRIHPKMPTDTTWHPTSPHFPKLETHQICITCLLLLSGSLIFIVLVFFTILFVFFLFSFPLFFHCSLKEEHQVLKMGDIQMFQGPPKALIFWYLYLPQNFIFN